jgi:hypothetical protein
MYAPVNGTLTSLIDVFYSLRERGRKVDFKIVSNDVGRDFNWLIRGLGTREYVGYLTNEKHFEAETMVISARLLHDILEDEVLTYKCDRLFILDSLNLQEREDLEDAVMSPDCTFLVNPANFCRQVNYKEVEYYHKFSWGRLRHLFHIKEVLNYRRSDKPHIKIGDIYFENIGKSIFEYLHNYSVVNYYADDIKDGLHYYLKLFDIDSTVDHVPLEISPTEIREKLFMQEDDILLND